MVDAVLESFNIPLQGLKEISCLLRKDFDKGLEREGDDVVVKMLNTYVHSLPDGSEKGKFLALDLGGSNFRVLLIEIKDRNITQLDKRFTIDDKTKQSTQEELFDFVAEALCEFEKEHTITEKLPLGFTFSFPVRQTGLTSGTLIRWTKDFTASGAVGQDVTKLLEAALKRKGSVTADVVALVNDTTGTQMAIGIEDQECYVGVILGTGTNACYLEDLKAVKKCPEPVDHHSHVIINTEWGAFGDDGTLEKWRTSFDRELDSLAKNKLQQTFEKMISGRYLGEMVRMVLVKLQDDGLFPASEKLRTPQVFESSFVTEIETGDGSAISVCKGILNQLGIEGATDDDCVTVRRVCEAVSTRAARLAATGIYTILQKIGRLDKCTVAIDGTLYEKHPHFRDRMISTLQELAPGNKVQLKRSKDGSGRGAATVVAVASRLYNMHKN